MNDPKSQDALQKSETAIQYDCIDNDELLSDKARPRTPEEVKALMEILKSDVMQVKIIDGCFRFDIQE